MKQAKNEGTWAVKWTYYNENDCNSDSPYKETPEPKAGTEDAPDDEDVSVLGEDNIMNW